MKTKKKSAKRPRKSRNSRNSPPKPRRKNGSRSALIALAVICAVFLGAGVYFAARSTTPAGNNPEMLLPDNGQEKTQNEIPIRSPELQTFLYSLSGTPVPYAKPAAAYVEATIQTASVVPAETAGRTGSLVLVIDDAGNSLRDLEPFLKFPDAITISVMPGFANSIESAKRVRTAGKELFLHQPMEPLKNLNPDPGIIRIGMRPAEIREILAKNINEIGPVSGFNNHEGSRATMDAEIMRTILEFSRDNGIIFLDSKTIANTGTRRIAKELGVAVAERSIFLDNEQDSESILSALEAGCRLAEKNGSAVLIGHVWSPRLAVILSEMYPELVKRGFTFATVSSFITEAGNRL